ncbi:hypothetical protein MTR67_016809 [Solanum verrucosum]|uniref:Btz domain-containing protein n=1 Tax=Solanum verrucosum TaxID=315347 RepID=A0AAF0TL94_SOLVR|nr:hypothetical protein MTR67_016809 [Solanum verrucosum]
MYLQPGVVVWQSSNSSSLLPYKKRYSVLYPHAPIHPLRNVDSGIMPVSGNEEPGVVARQSGNSLLPYKKRYYLLYPRATIHPSRNVDDLVKPALAEKLAGQEAVGTAKVSVKKEVVSKQGESHSKLELPADSGHIELSLCPMKLHVSSLVDSNTMRSCLMHGTVNPSLLSPSLNNNNADDTACTNRFNWDLNIPMDLWEASGDDLVASGEGSANDGEKISTEEECYVSDAFAGRVDTDNVGCVREDDIYEDGEIREPLMQSIAEDPMAEGMDSGKNNEEKGYSMPLHTHESHNNFMKACDEKSEKILHNVAVFRPVTGRSLPSRSGSERDEIYGYGPKFARDGFQDRSFGRSRGSFMHGRGMGWGWGRGRGRGRYSGRDFESYGGVAYYPFRHKRTAPAWESANERNDYDGAAFGTNRRRKPLYDELPSLRHPPARRKSPRGREDVAMMGTQMLRRAPRNICPRSCTGEDGFAYVGVRHSEKFNRYFPADSHQQSMYDGPDSHFAQGDTEFTAMQRSGFPRMWSKSPVRSCTWSLPPRRLTEGLNGRQDLSQHRSPTMYREDKIRSSSRTSFTEETIAPQRRDPPSYTACRLNDMRDVDGVQEYGNPRFLSSRRSPPDQVFTRTNRQRVEISDHHERADGVGYIDGPIHTGSFPEHHSGERSKYGERQGGPRQMRNVKEQEGGNLRLRHEEEFDGFRLKKRRF